MSNIPLQPLAPERRPSSAGRAGGFQMSLNPGHEGFDSTRADVDISISLYIYICRYILRRHTYINTEIRMYACMHVCMDVCMYIYVFLYIYIYTYTSLSLAVVLSSGLLNLISESIPRGVLPNIPDQT